MWFTFALFTVLCPYYTVYTSLMTFQIDKVRKKIEEKRYTTCNKVVSFFMIMPTMLILLILLDIFLMVLSTVMLILIFPFIWIPWLDCGRKVFKFYEKSENAIFKFLFGMSAMDVKGFRCQRTILQLWLESIP